MAGDRPLGWLQWAVCGPPCDGGAISRSGCGKRPFPCPGGGADPAAGGGCWRGGNCDRGHVPSVSATSASQRHYFRRGVPLPGQLYFEHWPKRFGRCPKSTTSRVGAHPPGAARPPRMCDPGDSHVFGERGLYAPRSHGPVYGMDGFPTYPHWCGRLRMGATASAAVVRPGSLRGVTSLHPPRRLGMGRVWDRSPRAALEGTQANPGQGSFWSEFWPPFWCCGSS